MMLQWSKMNRRDVLELAAGTVIAWPCATLAQQPAKIPQIGIFWHAGTAEEEGILYSAMHDGFAAQGYVNGKTINLIERFPGEIEGRFERFRKGAGCAQSRRSGRGRDTLDRCCTESDHNDPYRVRAAASCR
jgi:hypothetical protein